MALSHQFYWQDWFTKVRIKERENHTQNLYWFSLQEYLHLAVLGSLRTSAIKESSKPLCTCNSLKLYFSPELYKKQEISRVETLSTHKLVTLTQIKKVERN